jgi:hypothetical protein
VYLAVKDRNAAIKEYSILKRMDSNLAEQLYRAIYNDRLLVLGGK